LKLKPLNKDCVTNTGWAGTPIGAGGGAEGGSCPLQDLACPPQGFETRKKMEFELKKIVNNGKIIYFYLKVAQIRGENCF